MTMSGCQISQEKAQIDTQCLESKAGINQGNRCTAENGESIKRYTQKLNENQTEVPEWKSTPRESTKSLLEELSLDFIGQNKESANLEFS